MIKESTKFVKLLLRHEGLRLKPYKDSVGKLSIGIGRCIEDVGISEAEAYVLLNNDVARITQDAYNEFTWFTSLSVTRQDVVLSMIFNLGLEGFKKFKKMIEAIIAGNFERAADEMLNSTWAKQVGKRAEDLSAMMRTNLYHSFY